MTKKQVQIIINGYRKKRARANKIIKSLTRSSSPFDRIDLHLYKNESAIYGEIIKDLVVIREAINETRQ